MTSHIPMETRANWRDSNEKLFKCLIGVPFLQNRVESVLAEASHFPPQPAIMMWDNHRGGCHSTNCRRKVLYSRWRQNYMNTNHQMMLELSCRGSGISKQLWRSSQKDPFLRTRKRYREHSHLVKFSKQSLAFELLCLLQSLLSLHYTKNPKVNFASFYHFNKSILISLYTIINVTVSLYSWFRFLLIVSSSEYWRESIFHLNNKEIKVS